MHSSNLNYLSHVLHAHTNLNIICIHFLIHKIVYLRDQNIYIHTGSNPGGGQKEKKTLVMIDKTGVVLISKNLLYFSEFSSSSSSQGCCKSGRMMTCQTQDDDKRFLAAISPNVTLASCSKTMTKSLASFNQ